MSAIERRKVGGGRKELILQYPRIDAINHCPQKIHSEFQIVGAKELIDVGDEGSILLLQIRSRPRIAEMKPLANCPEPEGLAGTGAELNGKSIVAPPSVGCEGRSRFSRRGYAPRSVNIYGSALIAQQHGVAECQQQAPRAGVVPR